MPKAVLAELQELSLQPKKAKKPRSARRYILLEEWVYGYHLKNRHLRLLAVKYNMPWEKNPAGVMLFLMDFISRASGVYLKMTSAIYRGSPARIVTFLGDDGRKRVEMNAYSHEQMERVREIIGIPAGTRPKWFEVSDEDSDAEFSSDDECFPRIQIADWKRFLDPEFPIRVPGNVREVRDSSNDSFDESSDWSSDEDEESDSDSGILLDRDEGNAGWKRIEGLA